MQKFEIVDDGSIRTNFILSGKQLSETAKKYTIGVVKYVSNNADESKLGEISLVVHNMLKPMISITPNLTYDNLAMMLRAQTYEQFISYILTAYMTQDSVDPVHTLMYTYGRTLPLSHSKEWMDNYRINNIGYPLNMLVYHKYDGPDNYSISQEEPLPINESITDINFRRACKYLVTPFRRIVLSIDNNDESILTKNILDEALDNDEVCKRICDMCYLKYPVCYCGSHGCDVFGISNLSLTIPEITQVLRRYPSWHICYVLNTATYASGQGVHWVALELTQGHAKLICSQGSPFNSCFDDGGVIYSTLVNNGYSLEDNPRCIQHDDYNCGIFSPIALYMLIIYNGDIARAVNEGIGPDGVNIHGVDKQAGDINDIRDKVINSKH